VWFSHGRLILVGICKMCLQFIDWFEVQFIGVCVGSECNASGVTNVRAEFKRWAEISLARMTFWSGGILNSLNYSSNSNQLELKLETQLVVDHLYMSVCRLMTLVLSVVPHCGFDHVWLIQKESVVVVIFMLEDLGHPKIVCALCIVVFFERFQVMRYDGLHCYCAKGIRITHFNGKCLQQA
jgi:hypothetical protein